MPRGLFAPIIKWLPCLSNLRYKLLFKSCQNCKIVEKISFKHLVLCATELEISRLLDFLLIIGEL